MIVLNRRTKVFFCREATDMRCGFDSLFCRVKDKLEEDPFSGHLFVFLNQRRSTCKALIYDGTGLVLIAKRLERGLFSKLNPYLPGKIVLTQAEFNLFLEGVALDKRFIESPRDPRKGASKTDEN